jgi:hypothetical protein
MSQKSIFEQLCEEKDRFYGGFLEKKLLSIHSRSEIRALVVLSSDDLRVVVGSTIFWNGDGWISMPHARRLHLIQKSAEGTRLHDGRVLINSSAGDFSFYPRGLLDIDTIDGELRMVA